MGFGRKYNQTEFVALHVLLFFFFLTNRISASSPAGYCNTSKRCRTEQDEDDRSELLKYQTECLPNEKLMLLGQE